jgi:hypothetical protein
MGTLLENVTDALDELGLARVSTVTGSNNSTARQMLGLFNSVGDLLLNETDWQFMAKEHRFSTVFYQYTGNTTAGSTTISGLSSVVGLSTDFMVTGGGIPQDTCIVSVGVSSVVLSQPIPNTATGVTFTFGQALYDMPGDYDHIVNHTQYNKTNRWAVIGPKSPQEWQWLKASYITTGPRMRFRIMGDKFALWPMPVNQVTLGFEYQSKDWVIDNAGNGKTKFTADTDTSVFPDRLMVMGAKMRFLEAKGLDSSAEAAYFTRELSKFKAMNSGADTLSLAPSAAGVLLTTANIPDTGYGGVV